MCVGGMPASITEYINKEKNIQEYDEDITEMILASYIADMARYTENSENIR